jgi:hypothetical protein
MHPSLGIRKRATNKHFIQQLCVSLSRTFFKPQHCIVCNQSLKNFLLFIVIVLKALELNHKNHIDRMALDKQK